MRIICIVIAFFLSFNLIGCATNTNKEKKTTHLSKNTPTKNPLAVALYSGQKKPEKPYVVLGKGSVSKYNQVGIKRQEANIRDVMRHMAAKLGGDAVINISHDANTVTGTVIAFKSQENNSAEKA